MCEQAEINYLDGEVVWVKLGSCWWPGEVVAPEKLPPDVLPSFRKPPIAVVKFFQEDTYEYVKNTNAIYQYNCDRKDEFITKGLHLYRANNGPMEKFPEDIIRAETAVGGDIEILTRDEFQKDYKKKKAYEGLFGGTPKTPSSAKKGKGKGKSVELTRTPLRMIKEKTDYKVHILLQSSSTPSKPAETTTTTESGTEDKPVQDKNESESQKDQEEKTPQTPEKPPISTTPTVSSTGIYSCHACSFSTTRLNVLILHNKTHSVTFTPYTPSPAKKKVMKTTKSTPSTSKTPKAPRPRKEKPEKAVKNSAGKKRTSNESKADTVAKKLKTDQEIKSSLLADWDDVDEDESNDGTTMDIAASPEVAAAAESAVPTPAELSGAQVPTLAELPGAQVPTLAELPGAQVPTLAELPGAQVPTLAELPGAQVPTLAELPGAQVPTLAELPGAQVSTSAELPGVQVPTAAELPGAKVPTSAKLSGAQVPLEASSPVERKAEETPVEKPESTSDSKYEFCEDEDWPVEAGVGRKIPRVKNSSKRKDETKSLSLDDEEVAREVAELLNKTTVPELPSVPEPLKVEENFPEPSIVKSPDKEISTTPEPTKSVEKASSDPHPTKAIFKTKTFFRSRHSRSQDAIGKYVAEQLNAVERMDMSESEINGSDAVSSPEARESPPMEHVKVARLAPKIQLKKMKAEAAQLREKEKTEMDFIKDDIFSVKPTVNESISVDSINTDLSSGKPTINESISVDCINIEPGHVHESNEICVSPNLKKDVLYPTQEIKPINEVAYEENKTSFIKDSPDPPLPVEQVVESNEIVNKRSIIEEDKKSEANVSETDVSESNVSEANVVVQNDNIVCESVEIASEKIQSSESENQKDQEVLENTSGNFEQPYMNESTASAVDALLSVSRDTDRVTKVISDDPPEDLFEDDNKDNTIKTLNGFNENIIEDNENNVLLESEHIEIQKEAQNIGQESPNAELNVSEIETASKENMNEVFMETELINEECPSETVVETTIVPSESDLQIAEALINLPATAIHPKSIENVLTPTSIVSEDHKLNNVMIDDNVHDAKSEAIKPSESGQNIEHNLITDSENINVRFETELEKNENLNAAQSLVQMSESVDHKINIIESNTNSQEIPKKQVISAKPNNGLDKISTVEQKVASLSGENSNELINTKSVKYETTSSKLLKMLEEPFAPKIIKKTPTKQIIIPGKEKILNFDVAKQSLKGKSQSPVIIRRAVANKALLNNLNEIGTSDKIILSRSNKPQQHSSSVQTFTIQTSQDKPSDANKITIIQQKVRKVQKMPTKMQKNRGQNSLISQFTEAKSPKESVTSDDSVFDINSMPIVLSDELLTPESIDKMPIVMSDGNLITNSPNPPKLVKTKSTVVESDKVAVNAGASKSEPKTLLMNPVSEVNKVTTTPNIISKSSKLRGAKPMLIIDKATGKQKIIMTKSEPALKELKPAPTLVQPITQNTGKGEKFILLPTATTPRPGRTQKIVIDPQTGKAHVLVAKNPDTAMNANDNKPVSAKLIPSSSDASGPGNTVMIITNAQGAQSRIVLTSEHEKILFPNKQHQQNTSQMKTITHRITTNAANTQKQIVTSVPQMKTQTRIVPKQKSAIITSKGQLIVGGRVATTAQNIAPMPEIRPLPKRIVPAEPKKIIQAIQKTTSEPLILLQQKSGAVVQLTASQFEQIQRTGHFIQKIPVPVESKPKPVYQKTIAITPGEPPSIVQKRIRKTVMESPTPMKKVKQEIAIAPVPPPMVSLPALTPLSSHIVTTVGPSVSNTVSVTTTMPFADLDNFEEMLPSTAIVRQPQPEPAVAPVVVPPPPPPPPPVLAAVEPPAPAPLSDGQLLAVPGEHFGGPPGSFYLCVEDNGTLTPIDNRPLVLENNQLVPMAMEPLPMLAQQPERRDILEAALANSDVFHADPPRDEAPDFRDLNANVSVHCRVSETSTTLNQPIMTPIEVPSKVDSEPTTVPSNLEDGLAVIGVTPHTVPTSLELPITVTDPRIAPKTTDPLSGTNYRTSLLSSPNTEMTFVTTEDMEVPMGGPISMPLLSDEDAVGKSMPILTDDVTERTVSSVDSTIGSPSSIDVRESEMEDGTQWSRRLLTPGSDTSETSSEIPLQPAIQLSVSDMSRHS